ncbi:MAG: DUF551 domain-containing protein [Candidatus Ventricola sp.]|nr:DUF551 domain-containing protein [Candidatus Ventricola sp.]
MSNKPAPRCPGCGKEMELMELERNIWRYSCEDCGWRSPAVHGPGKDGKDVAYSKAMQRYKPVYDGYQGTAHEQGWPDQRAQTLHGGGELNFDVPPGRYPMVCQSTRETEEGHAAGQWISVEDELPKEEGKYIVCTEMGSVYCARFSKSCGYEGIFKTDTNTHITYWMPLPEPPKEGE